MRGSSARGPAARLARLPPGARRALAAAAALARQKRTPLYLAGGAVRDLLIGRPVRDLDLVVEGDGLAFGRDLARRLGLPVRAHPRFGTASIELPESNRLDVAGCRAETYAHPGALPRVRPGTMAEDLARRDFTINAMALRIWPGPCRLLDPHGGRADLGRGVVRMLHPASPRDDPTRAFRAVLYGNRLGFRLEPRTRGWIRDAVCSGAFERISGDRLRRELARILSEPGRAGALGRMSRLGLIPVLHPALSGDARARARLARAERLDGRPLSGATWLAYLLVWATGLTGEEARQLAARLNLPRGPARVLGRWPDRRRSAGAAPLDADEALALAALSGGRTARLSRDIRIRGADLLAAGIAPGPAVGRALAATRSARLAGRIPPEEELAFALRVAREAAS
ncbi:MAG: hypothetical protein ACM3SU_17085 [Acidobacteriota bacterium]